MHKYHEWSYCMDQNFDYSLLMFWFVSSCYAQKNLLMWKKLLGSRLNLLAPTFLGGPQQGKQCAWKTKPWQEETGVRYLILWIVPLSVYFQVPLLYSTMLRKLYLKGPNNPSQAGLDSPSRDSIAIADAFAGLKVEEQRTRSQSRNSRRSSKEKDCRIMWYFGLWNTPLLELFDI